MLGVPQMPHPRTDGQNYNVYFYGGICGPYSRVDEETNATQSSSWPVRLLLLPT